MKKIAILAAVLSVFTLAGCNATKGLGQDISKAGDKLEEAADNTGATN
ncbi:entericidin A/B family lipoprotein [Suttonella ornithocola]|uniref:Entericidin B membrane lipoprotein n=1 Tax=Suttonella ornithocola TaxID=279832 RepID=A0A380MZN8_9GAMM|nr:entericidin A/B family lipoprotein [Suttonella ornithocola]SUO97151.1 entericidin B membrane lipoprotein [Suttonella ornithocola]